MRKSRRFRDSASGYVDFFLEWKVDGVIYLERRFVASFSGMDGRVFLVGYACSMGRVFCPFKVVMESSSFVFLSSSLVEFVLSGKCMGRLCPFDLVRLGFLVFSSRCGGNFRRIHFPGCSIVIWFFFSFNGAIPSWLVALCFLAAHCSSPAA